MDDMERLRIIKKTAETAEAHEAFYLHKTLEDLLSKKFTNKMGAVITHVLKNKPQRLLDIGCGYGALALFFGIRNIATTGIDLDFNALEKGQRLSKLLELDNVDLIKMDAAQIELHNFDLATSTDFYEHMSADNQVLHLNSIYKALNSGGCYYIRAPHVRNIRQHREDHIGLPSFASLTEQAQQAGFAVSFTLAHTPWILPGNYQLLVEKWISSKDWSPHKKYKALQKCGLANIIAKLEKH